MSPASVPRDPSKTIGTHPLRQYRTRFADGVSSGLSSLQRDQNGLTVGIHFSLAPFDLSRSPSSHPRPSVVLAPSRGVLVVLSLTPRVFRVRLRWAVNGEQKALGAHAPAFSLSLSRLSSSLFSPPRIIAVPYHRHREIAGRHLSFASPGWPTDPRYPSCHFGKRLRNENENDQRIRRSEREIFAAKLRETQKKNKKK